LEDVNPALAVVNRLLLLSMSFFPRSIALVSKKLTKILSSTTPWTCTGWEECYDDDDDDTAQTTESDCIENGSATLGTTLGESSSTLLLPLAPTTHSSSNSSDEEVVRPNQAIIDDRRDDDNNKSSDDNVLTTAVTNGDDIVLGEASRQPPPQARECCNDIIEKETNSPTVTNRKSNALRPALRIKTQDCNNYYDTPMIYRSSRSSSSKPRTTTVLRTTAHDYQTTIDGRGGGYDYETHRPRMIRNSSRNSICSSSNYSGGSKQRTMDSSSSSSNYNRRFEKGSSSSSRTTTQRHPHSSKRRHHKQQHVRTSNNNNNRSYTIQFDPSVIVISIPSHRDYTPATWLALHCTEYETLSSIERNTKEFTYEKWDWKCVIEEDDMVFDSSVGKFIHPIYYTIQAATTTTTTNNTSATTTTNTTTARGSSSTGGNSSSSNNS
jgi:hypothetical protein